MNHVTHVNPIILNVILTPDGVHPNIFCVQRTAPFEEQGECTRTYHALGAERVGALAGAEDLML